METNKIKLHLPKLIEESEQKLLSTLNFDQKYHQKIREPEHACIKMNHTSVLREEHALKIIQQEDNFKKEQLFDSSEFKEWKNRMNRLDE